tara:strand:+ start:842 stop:1333 length:492 start_codon:yes stop_codon:yes gene_type:complete
MPYTLTFLDDKLRQSLSFDADMKFPEATEYSKKIWVLKEYQRLGGELDLSENDGPKTFSTTHSSYSLQKSFEGDELVVELIQNIKFFDDFDYFAEAKIEETGDEELDKTLSDIKDSNFKHSKIAEIFGLNIDPRNFGDFKQPSQPIEDSEDCSPDCDCDCDSD